MTLFDQPLARDSDPETSHKAAVQFKRDSIRHKLLRQYNYNPAFADGLTDEEAAAVAYVGPGGWKRCSDLRNAGMIEPVGTRTASTGAEVMVCKITFAGKRELGRLA